MLRRVQFALIGLFAAALAGMIAVPLIAPRLGVTAGDHLGRGDYTLQTTDGQRFTAATLRGKPSAVFFGYTHCPDVCPTTLGDIAVWQQDLGPQAADLRIFFVTVDPDRDTGPMLRDYLSWTEGVTGVTGPRAQIDRAIAAFNIFARKVDGPEGDYTMDHTASIRLFDGQGRFVGNIGYQEPPDTVLPKLKSLIATGSGA